MVLRCTQTLTAAVWVSLATDEREEEPLQWAQDRPEKNIPVPNLQSADPGGAGAVALCICLGQLRLQFLNFCRDGAGAPKT